MVVWPGMANAMRGYAGIQVGGLPDWMNMSSTLKVNVPDVPPLLNVKVVPLTGWVKVTANPPLFSVEMLPAMLAVKDVFCPPLIPGGAVNVICKLKSPLAAIGVGL